MNGKAHVSVGVPTDPVAGEPRDLDMQAITCIYFSHAKMLE
jgi:hypothetical protein